MWDDVLLKDVMTPGSELLQTMADKLNRELPAVKNWKNLASQLEIPVDVRREYADESTGEKRKSPTKEGRGDLSVIYVERQKNLTDICSEILDRLSSRRWSASDDLVSLAKRKLSELQEDTVIVLDNTEDVQGEDFDEFAEWLVRSAPKAQLMITTGKDVGFVSADKHKVNLDPLDAESSAKLLQTLVQSNCSEQHVKELGQRCGGMPLFLINCSCLLNDDFQPRGLNPRT
ncbi:hypothetical protein OS493_027983 [Desmophyllum pertusum]|uniref:Uncharacterized protein n=1 Tax=Desmophyllum pertusum TaxID=174260 RepID=A0A9X0CEV1_9CNID|nr:hypothetical protein OS493_027983 [Desmophyllum pertusum]